MKQLFMALALVGLVSAGCAQSNLLGNKLGSAPKVTRGQSPDYGVMQASYNEDGGCMPYNTFGPSPGLDNVAGCDSCDASCGCCETGCGYAEDCGCGCPQECCDMDCCDSGCCDSGCCGASCGCGDECTCGCPGNGCGCGNGSCGNGCTPCQLVVGAIASGGCCPHSQGYPEYYNFNPGPPSGQVAYPYYTTRGPRDFLQNNPQRLGPY